MTTNTKLPHVAGTMESVQDNFVSMIVDRLQALEQSVDELRASNEQLRSEFSARSEALYLTPHSRYTEFSDGFGFHWDIMCQEIKAPTMSHQDDEVPLDYKHWNAIVFPSGVTLHEYDMKDDMRVTHTFTVGRVGHPVTVRELVDCVHAAMQVKYDHFGDFWIGEYDGMRLSRAARRHDMELCIIY